MSPLSNSSYTVYLFGKLVKRKFQGGVTTKWRGSIEINRRHIPIFFCESVEKGDLFTEKYFQPNRWGRREGTLMKSMNYDPLTPSFELP